MRKVMPVSDINSFFILPETLNNLPLDDDNL